MSGESLSNSQWVLCAVEIFMLQLSDYNIFVTVDIDISRAHAVLHTIIIIRR